MNELLYECYSAPAVTYAIDALLAYRQNKGRTGLVVSSSHSYTHLIPVVDGRPALASASRLNWGGQQAADYLMKLVKLKYPNLPNGVRLTDWQMQALVREHCYVAPSFDAELARFLDWSGLEGRDHVLQFPFTEHVVAEKTAEELARVAERKKESGRRLQEQAAKMRLDKLIRKEQDLEYFRDLREKLANATKKEIKRLLDEDEFRDEAALDKKIRDLEASIRKARNKDVGGAENEEEQEPPSFPLLDVPDEQLDEASIKQKRHQRLMKSGVEARQRARAEKEAEKARLAEEQRRDDERRETDLPGWLAEKRGARTALVQRLKDQERFKADLGNRKSMASQMRMKTLANLAADQPGRKRRRGGAAGGDDDTFGANDDDWGVYRQVQQGPEASDDSDEEDLPAGLKAVEALLLEHDPDFDEGDTLAARSDWTQSLVHAFLRGPRPFDPESAREAHQVHLNVERIRVPEVVFQPAIAGLDQAGLVEIAADILTQRLAGAPAERDAVLRDVFLTGGNTMFKGFQERLEAELRGVLPVEAVVGVRLAADPLLDAWKGAAGWARDGGAAKAAVSRAEYFEKGSEYLKVCAHLPVSLATFEPLRADGCFQEHEYGNVGGW